MTVSARTCLAAALAAFFTCAADASDIRKDEEVMFFRTGVAQATESTQFLPVRAWVFEPERRSFWRRMLLRGLVKALGLPKGSDSNKIFKARTEYFLTDSESRKDVSIRFAGGATHTLPRTPRTGITHAVFAGPPGAPVGPIGYRAVLPEGDDRQFKGEILVSPAGGLGVISDIDDTVKVTVVKKRKEMLKNTFLRPFEAVPGMAEKYREWAAEGVIFHYVSNSPVQLYPSLEGFLDKEDFPRGGVHLRHLFSRDEPESMPEERKDHKIDSIEAILAAHPDRKFVLVGDSGEHDPDFYAQMARKYPDRIHKILIRKAPFADESPGRYEKVFEGLPAELWSVFGGAEELGALR